MPHSADFSESDWRRLKDSDNVHVAVALAEIGRDELASQVLIHEAKIGDPRDFAPLSRLARELGLPQTQLYMAYNAPIGASPDPASRYPAPKWAPANGWQVDPALAFAHTLQELAFRGKAISPADARGLMQITPITVREFAPRLGLSASDVNIFDPATNLAFGQQNLKMLRDSAATQGELPKIMAAYNAGLLPVTRWNTAGQRPGRSAAVHGIDSLLGDARLRRDGDAQLLDVRTPGQGALGHAGCAGRECLADVPGREPGPERAGLPERRQELTRGTSAWR